MALPTVLVLSRTLIASGLEFSLKAIDVRARGHRHHGLWYDLRSIMSASLVILAIVKIGNAVWISGSPEALWCAPDEDSNAAPAGGWSSEAD